jgi:hypothetical protein
VTEQASVLEEDMSVRAFNIFGRIVGTLLGLAVMCAGLVWILQAFDMAFNTPIVPGGPVSFMVNNRQWAIYGAIAVLVGLGQVLWTNTHSASSSHSERSH